jgi:ribosome-associated translation inhibitor RaiA
MHDHGLIDDEVERIVERKASRLDRRLEHVDPELKLLDVGLDHHLRTETIDAKLILNVLDRQLVAHGRAEKSEQALREAFDNLEDKLEEFLARLRREPEIREAERRSPRRGQAKVPKAPEQ